MKRDNDIGEKTKKKRRIRTKRENIHRMRVLMLWFVLISAFAFAVYKNFTAVDVRHEIIKETVKEKVVDTNAVETFVKGFVYNYYAWESTREDMERWQQSLADYMTEDLQKLNMSSMPSDLSVSSSIGSADIWSVEKSGKQGYKVVYSVGQTIKKGKDEEWIWSAYMIRVHIDTRGNMVIVQNPSMYQIPGVSNYKPKEMVSSGDLSGKQKEITVFLDTFFKMYPTATQNELEFYVSGDALPSVNVDRYIYNKLEKVILNPGKSGTINAAVTVSYVNMVTDMTEYNQYELVLEKGDNWKIIKEGFETE